MNGSVQHVHCLYIARDNTERGYFSKIYTVVFTLSDILPVVLVFEIEANK